MRWKEIIHHLLILLTDDEYELHLYVAETAEELSRITGVNVNTIRSSVSHVRSGRNKSSIYQKVEWSEEDV